MLYAPDEFLVLLDIAGATEVACMLGTSRLTVYRYKDEAQALLAGHPPARKAMGSRKRVLTFDCPTAPPRALASTLDVDDTNALAAYALAAAGPNMVYAPASNAWYIFRAEQHRFVHDSSASKIVARGELRRLLAKHPSLSQDKARMKLAEITRAAEVLAQQSTEHQARARSLDTKVHLVPLLNGVWDFATDEFRPGQPEDLLTTQAACAFAEWAKLPLEQREEVEAWLARLFPDECESTYVLWNLAQALLGNQTKRFNMFFGPSHSGKSSLENLMVASLGSLVGFMPESVLTKRVHINTKDPAPELVDLMSRRVVFVNELSKNARLHAAIVKVLTSGGDAIKFRAHRGVVVDHAFKAWLCLVTNFVPKFDEGDQALVNRFRVMRFSQCLPVRAEMASQAECERMAPAFMAMLIDNLRQNLSEPPCPWAELTVA